MVMKNGGTWIWNNVKRNGIKTTELIRAIWLRFGTM